MQAIFVLSNKKNRNIPDRKPENNTLVVFRISNISIE